MLPTLVRHLFQYPSNGLPIDGLDWKGIAERSLIFSCFFLSGFSALLLETVWSQQLILVFGSSDISVVTVLAAYMGGLAIGAGVAGRWVHRVRSVLLVYGLLELGIGLSALLVPLLLVPLTDLQWSLFSSVGLDVENPGYKAIFYFAGAFVLLVLPTAFMGATLPLLSRYLVRTESQIGQRVGLLYTLNTLGAAIGALSGAFWLLPSFSLGSVIWVAVGINVLIFAAVVLWSRSSSKVFEKRNFGVTESIGGASARIITDNPWILPAMMISGFVALGYEVLWARMLGHLLGGSLYAFGTILFTFLIGIAIGAAIASPLSRRQNIARLGFIVSQLMVAITFTASFVLVHKLIGPTRDLSFGGGDFLLISVACGTVTLLPGAIFFGATFPFAVRLRTHTSNAVGLASSQVYLWNTLGAIGGSVATGFFLLPGMRLEGTATVLVAASLVLAATTSMLLIPRYKMLGVTAVSALLILWWRPLPVPERLLKSSQLQKEIPEGELAYYQVGRHATVTLVPDADGLRLASNGLMESTIYPPGTRTRRNVVARWLAKAPVLLYPETKTMLMIGFGGGISAASVPESVERIDIVELEPEIISANQSVVDWRDQNPFADERIKVHINDARSALSLSRMRFDAIVSQPSHPWTAGSSQLFTREFFERVNEHLVDKGIFSQWIGLHFLDETLLASLVATLSSVFPNVELYQPNSQAGLLFLASRSSLSAPPEDHPLWKDWRELGVNGPVDLRIARRLDADGAREFSEGAPIIEDYHNLLRIRSPRVMSKPMDWGRLERLVGPLDPLRHELDKPDVTYIMRRLAMESATLRASNLLSRIRLPSRRAEIKALVAAGIRPQAQLLPRLWALFLQAPEDPERYSALLLAGNLVPPEGPNGELLREALQTDPVARAILESVATKRTAKRARVERMIRELSRTSTTHPLYRVAIMQQIEHLSTLNDRTSIVTAIKLVDQLLAVRMNPWLLIRRTELAMQGGLAAEALASAGELAEKAEKAKKHSSLRYEMVLMINKMLKSRLLQDMVGHQHREWLEARIKLLD